MQRFFLTILCGFLKDKAEHSEYLHTVLTILAKTT